MLIGRRFLKKHKMTEPITRDYNRTAEARASRRKYEASRKGKQTRKEWRKGREFLVPSKYADRILAEIDEGDYREYPEYPEI